MMVDESERIWSNIDLHAKSLGDHCIRLTKLEQTHLYTDKTRNNLIIYALAGVVIVEFFFLIIDRLGT